MSPELDLSNPAVLIFPNLYVSAKIFTPIGLIIAPEENRAYTVSGECKYSKITHVERNRNIWLFASFITEQKPRTFHWAKVCQSCHQQNTFWLHPESFPMIEKDFHLNLGFLSHKIVKPLSRGKMLNPKLISEKNCKRERRVSTDFHIILLKMWRTGHFGNPEQEPGNVSWRFRGVPNHKKI